MTRADGLSPFEGRDVTWLLESRVAAAPDREFLVWRDLEGGRDAWTYAQTAHIVAGAAAGLARAGIGRGDRVVIHSENCPEYVFAWLALRRLGAVMVTTNTKSAGTELTDYLRRVDCRLVLTQARYSDSVSQAGPGIPIVVFDLSADAVASSEYGSFSGLILGGDDATGSNQGTDRPVLDPMSPAGIQFTSGTTSRAKGVVWTEANYLWAGRIGASHQGLTCEDRYLVFLPLFHTNAQSYSVMATLWVGGTIVLMPRFSRTWFWPVAVEERTTYTSTIPFAIRALQDLPVPEHSFRAWGNGIVAPSWERRFGVETVSWWGMTETVSHPIVSELDGPRRPRAMGLPAPEYGVRVVDDDGIPLTAPGDGLLEVRGVRGVSLMLEYLDDPETTDDAFTDDGWLITGDRVVLHPDGWLSFLERDKDMLKVGAENVAALEIERVVLGVPGVVETAVVAGPDRMLDEVPVAFVIAEPGRDPDALVDEVLAACRQHLAGFKVPRHVEIVGELPRSLLGKVAKNVLRDRASDLLDD